MTDSKLIEHYADRVDMVIGGGGSLNAVAPDDGLLDVYSLEVTH